MGRPSSPDSSPRCRGGSQSHFITPGLLRSRLTGLARSGPGPSPAGRWQVERGGVVGRVSLCGPPRRVRAGPCPPDPACGEPRRAAFSCFSLRDSWGLRHSPRTRVPVRAVWGQALPSAASWKKVTPRQWGPAPETRRASSHLISGNSFCKRDWWRSVGGPLGPPVCAGYLELVEVTGGSRRETQGGVAGVPVASGHARARPPLTTSWHWVSTCHLDREAPGQY